MKSTGFLYSVILFARDLFTNIFPALVFENCLNGGIQTLLEHFVPGTTRKKTEKNDGKIHL